MSLSRATPSVGAVTRLNLFSPDAVTCRSAKLRSRSCYGGDKAKPPVSAVAGGFPVCPAYIRHRRGVL